MAKIKDNEEKMAVILLLLQEGAIRISRVTEKYQARLYQLGIDAGVDIGGMGELMTVAEISRRVSKIVSDQAGYVSKWINEDFARRLSLTMHADYKTVAKAQDAIIRTSVSYAYRAKNFALSGHGTAFKGLRDEMIWQDKLFQELNKGWKLEAIFTAFPESDVIATSCDGCIMAVGGNPYVPETVPSPGDFQCSFNCRHEIWYRKVPIASVAA